MFKYIDMPKLVAWYLREFSYNQNGEPSTLYKFLFCLCLPFVSRTFRTARLNALAIAECTNSRDQISRVLNKITGAELSIKSISNDYMMPYNGTDNEPDFPYDGASEEPIMTYALSANAEEITVKLNGASKEEVAGYLELLIPFYVYTTIIWE